MVSLRDLAPLPDELKPINGNLPRESIITGGEVRLHSDTGRKEEDQVTQGAEMLDTTDPDTIAFR